jgi:type II secretory pathway pseudopilin PulG
MIELVIVVAIIAAVALMSLPFLGEPQRRLRSLQKDQQNVVNLIDRARFGAMSGSTDWLLTLDPNTPNGQLALGPDDGWTRDLGAANIRSQIFDPNNADLFDPNELGNNALSDSETVTTHRLSPSVKLLSDFGGESSFANFQCPTWIKFRHDGSVESNLGAGSMIVLWLVDIKYFQTGLNRYLSEMQDQEEWVKPVVILPTGGVYIPLDS